MSHTNRPPPAARRRRLDRDRPDREAAVDYPASPFGRADRRGPATARPCVVRALFDSPVGPPNAARFLLLDPRGAEFYPEWDQVVDDIGRCYAHRSAVRPTTRSSPTSSASCLPAASPSAPAGPGTTCGFGDLNLDDANIDAEARLREVQIDSGSLTARGMTVARSLEYANSHARLAAPQLAGAKIGGNLILAAGTRGVLPGIIMDARGADVGGDVCITGSSLHGGLDLRGMHIGGDLLQGADFADAKTAINAHGIEVRGDALLSRGFKCACIIDLSGATIGRRVDFDDALFDVDSCRVSLDWADVREYVTIHPRTGPAHISLWHATVGAYYDDASTWPRTLRLDGFDFNVIQARPHISAGKRLEWVHLHRTEDSVDAYRYTPEIYGRLGAAYTRGGYRDAARAIGIAKQWDRVAAPASGAPRSPMRWYAKLAGSYLLRLTVGYGYRPWRIVWLIGALLFVGQFLFSYAHRSGDIILKDAGSPADFSAFRYSFDALVPVVDHGARDAFFASGSAAWLDSHTQYSDG